MASSTAPYRSGLTCNLANVPSTWLPPRVCHCTHAFRCPHSNMAKQPYIDMTPHDSNQCPRAPQRPTWPSCTMCALIDMDALHMTLLICVHDTPSNHSHGAVEHSTPHVALSATATVPTFVPLTRSTPCYDGPIAYIHVPMAKFTPTALHEVLCNANTYSTIQRPGVQAPHSQTYSRSSR